MELVRTLVADGTTVLLTTQYLEEADQLANRISVIDAGRVVAEGSPDELKSMTGGDRIEVVVREAADLTPAARLVARICGAEPERDPAVRRLSAPVVDRVAGLIEVVRALDDAGIAVEDIGLRRATLDEAFLFLTGHRPDEARRPGETREPDETHEPDKAHEPGETREPVTTGRKADAA
ncbi:hypothetical protein GCM10027614_54050 [Micromonospora vulcania]